MSVENNQSFVQKIEQEQIGSNRKGGRESSATTKGKLREYISQLFANDVTRPFLEAITADKLTANRRTVDDVNGDVDTLNALLEGRETEFKNVDTLGKAVEILQKQIVSAYGDKHEPDAVLEACQSVVRKSQENPIMGLLLFVQALKELENPAVPILDFNESPSEQKVMKAEELMSVFNLATNPTRSDRADKLKSNKVTGSGEDTGAKTYGGTFRSSIYDFFANAGEQSYANQQEVLAILRERRGKDKVPDNLFNDPEIMEGFIRENHGETPTSMQKFLDSFKAEKGVDSKNPLRKYKLLKPDTKAGYFISDKYYVEIGLNLR